jgi:peptide/nickel transport system substrate-binding protein
MGIKASRIFPCLAAASSALILAACSAQSASSTAGTSRSSSPAPLSVAIATPVTTLDPAQACDDTSYLVVQQLYDELVQPEVTGDRTDPSVMRPMLAQSWTITDSGRLYTFDIRKGVQFVNGDPLTAADVVFSLKRDLAANGCGAYIVTGGLTGNIRSIVELSRYVVRIRLARPDPVFLLDLGRQVGIIDQTLLEAHGGLSQAGNTWLASHDVGSGPYELSAYDPESQIVLKARRDYWAGPPKNSRVSLQVVTDPSSLELLVKNGGVNLAIGAPLGDLDNLARSPGVTVAAIPSLSYINVGFNVSRAPLDNQLVRQALTYATPVGQLMTAFGAGYVRAWVGPLLPGQLFYRPIADPYSYDIAMAKALLHQAGVRGASLTLVMSAGEPTEQNIATVLQSSWAKVGITLHITTVSPADFMNELNGFKDQLYMITDRANPDPGFYFGYFVTCGNPFNWSRYCNSTVTRLLNQARFSTNPAVRAADYHQVQGIVAKQAPYLQLFDLDQVFVTHGRVSGLVFYYDVTPRFASMASESG